MHPQNPQHPGQTGAHTDASPTLSLDRVTLGPFETNCYIVRQAPSKPGDPCWIVDAGFDPGPLIERIRELGLKPELLILTHAHVDHIAGVDEVLRAFPGTPVLIHSAEADWLSDPVKNLGLMMGMRITAQGPTRTLAHNEQLRLGGTAWRILHTPGHSPGGITLHCEGAHLAVVGDTLFAGSIGRTDFPGSDLATLETSIRERLYSLPPETTIHPGHGPSTTIAKERLSNPFVRAAGRT
jgi:hydroxyacylglutathione hydrolase